MFPCTKNRNERTFAKIVLPLYQKPERAHIRQNRPCTKPPFCFLSTLLGDPFSSHSGVGPPEPLLSHHCNGSLLSFWDFGVAIQGANAPTPKFPQNSSKVQLGVPKPGCFRPGCLHFFYAKALFCALLRSFADLRLRSFTLILRSFARFCVRQPFRTTAIPRNSPKIESKSPKCPTPVCRPHLNLPFVLNDVVEKTYVAPIGAFFCTSVSLINGH